MGMQEYMQSNRFMSLNDEDRRQWVQNDEGLYNWWKSTGIGLYRFVNENRQAITEAIQGRDKRSQRNASAY